MKASRKIEEKLALLQVDQEKPADVISRTSFLTFWQYILPGWVIAFPVTILLCALAVKSDSAPVLWVILTVAGAGLIWSTYRAFWAWAYRPYEASCDSGMLEWGEKGPLWLGLEDSPRDGVKLNTFDTNTPNRTLSQRMFRCYSYLLPDGKRVIRNIRNADLHRINAIRNYLNTTGVREVALGDLSLETSLAHLRQAEKNGVILREGVQVLGEVKALLGEIKDQHGQGITHADAVQISSALDHLQSPPDPS